MIVYLQSAYCGSIRLVSTARLTQCDEEGKISSTSNEDEGLELPLHDHAQKAPPFPGLFQSSGANFNHDSWISEFRGKSHCRCSGRNVG